MKFGLVIDKDKIVFLKAGREVLYVEEEAHLQGRRLIAKSVQVIAVYYDEEFSDSDLEVIHRHADRNEGGLLGVDFKVYANTHYEPYESLRKWKQELLEERGLEDDGTIFGRVFVDLVIPERVVVIPAHTHKKYVGWNCWNDSFDTELSEGSCDCGCGYKGVKNDE